MAKSVNKFIYQIYNEGFLALFCHFKWPLKMSFQHFMAANLHHDQHMFYLNFENSKVCVFNMASNNIKF